MNLVDDRPGPGSGGDGGARSLGGVARTLVRSADLRLFAAALACHVGLLLAVVGAARYLHPPQPLPVRFDAGWYVRAAQEGYPHEIVIRGGRVHPSTLAFFPLFPLLGRLLATVTRLPVGTALMAISLVCGAAAAPVIRRVVAVHRPGPVATVTAWAWVFTPLAGLTVIGYTEALFVLLAAAFLLSVLRGRWPAAAVLGLAAGLTRPTGMLLAVVAVPAVVTSWRSGRPRDPAAVAGPVSVVLAPVAGFACWMAVLRGWTGRWDAWWVVEQAWGTKTDGGLRAAGWVYGLAVRPGPVSLVLLGYLVVLAVLTVLVLAGDGPAAVKMFTLAVVVTVVMARKEVPRFLMPAFTLPVPAAGAVVRWARGSTRRYAAVALVASAASLAGAVFVLFLNHEPP